MTSLSTFDFTSLYSGVTGYGFAAATVAATILVARLAAKTIKRLFTAFS